MMLSGKEKERLEMYLEKCKEMMNSSFIKNRPKEFVETLTFKEDGTQHIHDNSPEKESIKAFLMDFRLFFGDGDINFNSIHNLLYTRISDTEVKKQLCAIREYYNKRLKTSAVGFEYNNKAYSPEDILRSYLYGDYFHIVEDKRIFLEDMEYALFLKSEFICLLYELANYISCTGSIVRDVLSGKIK